MPARFVVRLTASFQRDLEDLPTPIQAKVLNEIKRLETSPYGPPPKIKKLKGKGVGQWRLEVWPYRVRYDVIGREVVLYRVRHPGRATPFASGGNTSAAARTAAFLGSIGP